MRDVLGPGTVLGYCTNVHAGRSLDEIKQHLERHAVSVKNRVSPREPMGVGLWFHAEVAHELVASEGWLLHLREWLEDRGLLPYTINGFPYGDFHAGVVKHHVYRPNWATLERLKYTMNLAVILQTLLPAGSEGSISTVPIGWRADGSDGWEDHLAAAARGLAELRSQSGTMIHLDLEPEPGCAMEVSDDVMRHYESVLAAAEHEDNIREHVRVCHDICHAAVMFEDQKQMFDRYRAAGIRIGKVQISNSIRAEFRNRAPAERAQIVNELRRFSEDRYLHQTVIESEGASQFYEDLPLALSKRGHTQHAGDEWRVHFHVPVYLETFGSLHTTRDRITECMGLLRGSDVQHWEVETYAWNVLPVELRVDDLSDGIAREMEWVIAQAKALPR